MASAVDQLAAAGTRIGRRGKGGPACRPTCGQTGQAGRSRDPVRD